MADSRPEPLAAPHRCRSLVDWRRVAKLVAEGTPLAEIARGLGCSRSQLSRRRNHDPVFQGWIEEARRRYGAEEPAGAPIPGLRRALTAAIETEVRAGNVRVILWLADRLKLLDAPPTERTPGGALRDMLGSLTPVELREFASLRDGDEDGGAAEGEGGAGRRGARPLSPVAGGL